MRLRVITQKYPCDGCTACCRIMAIVELGKPFYTPCIHVEDKGCGIYDTRPASCRDFVCSWAAGMLGDGVAWRPDRSGLMFFLRRNPDGLWLEIYETAAGAAADAQRLAYLVQRIVTRVERTDRIVGTRLHHAGDRIGLGFSANMSAYPGSQDVSEKMNRFAWIDGNPARQVFLECHDPPDHG